MMKFNLFKGQKKAEQKKQSDAAFEAFVDAFIVKAEALEDPTEKTLAFRQLQIDLAALLKDTNDEMQKKANKKTFGMRALVGIPVAVGGFAVMAAAHTFLIFGGGIFMIMTGTGVGELAAGVRKHFALKKLDNDMGARVTFLEKRLTDVSARLEALIEENALEIAKSPLHNQFMKDEQLSRSFMAAATRRLDAGAQKAPEPAPQKPAPRVPEVNDYKHITDAMKERQPPAAQKPAPKRVRKPD